MAPVRRQRIDAEQLQIWRDYIETAEAIGARLAARLQSESGLSPGDYGVLLALREAQGRRLRSSALAEAVGWERSRLSHHLGRMERRGLIVREPSVEDPRGADVVLTEDGADAFRRSSVPHLRAVEELFFEAYSPADLQDVQRLTGVLRAHLALDRRSAGTAEVGGGPELPHTDPPRRTYQESNGCSTPSGRGCDHVRDASGDG